MEKSVCRVYTTLTLECISLHKETEIWEVGSSILEFIVIGGILSKPAEIWWFVLSCEPLRIGMCKPFLIQLEQNFSYDSFHSLQQRAWNPRVLLLLLNSNKEWNQMVCLKLRSTFWLFLFPLNNVGNLEPSSKSLNLCLILDQSQCSFQIRSALSDLRATLFWIQLAF